MWAARISVLVALSACTFEPAESASAPWQLSSSLDDPTQDVALSGRITVQLDRCIAPRTLGHASVRVRSGAITAAATYSFDPLAREIWVDIADAAPLVARTTYLLEVDGLVDLDGQAQPEPYRVAFQTGDALGAPLPNVPIEVPGILSLLADRCASTECHGGAQPIAQLDLSSAAHIERTAIGRQPLRALGALGDEGARGSPWLNGLRIIDVVSGRGDPATSYLIYKVLGDPHVLGEPMPPDGQHLSRAEIDALSNWIRAGAPTR